MPDGNTIEVEGRFVEVEPDGSECGMCGERSFLKSFVMVLRDPAGREVGRSKGVLCGSCREVIGS